MYFVLLWLELFRLPATAIMLLQCARLNQSLFWNIKSSEKARHYISHADFKNKHPVGKVNGISGFTLPDSDVQKVMSATFNDRLLSEEVSWSEKSSSSLSESKDRLC